MQTNLNLHEQSSIHDLIDSQTDRCPQAVALVCGDQQMTYQELDARANQLAHHLMVLGVRPEMLIGICTTRSLEMVVGILGILKAGGAYVPLDPSYPPERLAFVLQDAQAEFVVTQDEFLEMFGDRHVQTVSLDGDWSDISHQPRHRPANGARPENLAYVIYTSGSTGKPKGVMIAHSSLCHFVRIACSALDVTPRDVYLQTASIAYALSVRQLMVPLAWGVTIVMATSAEVRDPLALFELIKRRNITLMDVVPSFWRSCIQRLMELPSSEARELLNNSLRRIVSIGEALTYDLPHEWASSLGHPATLVNIFGQTETTGVVATYAIPREAAGSSRVVPIGKSVRDTRLYILDAELKPVQAGEQGELCVSNPCLARGYLNRPELTAEKFIPNPFDDGLSARLYRTGDMARLNDDGNIEFLGRGDQQVKIRGQRLELGEVEALIREHPSVKDCVVTARRNLRDENYLAAYIVPVAGQALEIPNVREFVRSKAPDYMIPSAFVSLDLLPLTPNGKIDRLALPDPSSVQSDERTSDSFIPPRNHIERTIAAIWKSLLNLDHVSIHDDYFDLGGHSLMSVQMFARIERELGIRLPLTSLFRATTIAQIAELVANANVDVTEWKIAVPVQPCGDKPPFFGVHGHEGGVLFWRNIVSHLPQNQPFYALQALGVDGIQTPLKRIPDMARLYLREIRKIQPHGPYYLGGYSMGGEIAFEMAQQLIREGETVDLLVMFDTRNPRRSIRPMARASGGALLPKLDAPRPMHPLDILKRKVMGHYLRLSVLSPRLRILYVLNQISTRIRDTGIAALVKLLRGLGRPLPHFLLRQHLKQSHGEALMNYVPTVYPGAVTLFRATQTLKLSPDDSPLGWGPLAAGGLEVYHFEASHNIVSARYAKEVAEKLNECLQKARGEI